MTILGVRSLRLTTDTSSAWRSIIRLADRGLTIDQIMRQGFTTILNLGKSSFIPDMAEYPDQRVWNHGDNIKPLLYPGLTRELMGELMPPMPRSYPANVWLKAPGHAGRGKFMKAVDYPLVLPKEWDWQEHIAGIEYRLVTVGHRVVQDHIRRGSNGDRSYEWLPMADTPSVMKEMAREAARKVPGDNVIAWDLIQQSDGTPYLFEGNTCPGTNTDTVRRIVDAMKASAE